MLNNADALFPDALIGKHELLDLSEVSALCHLTGMQFERRFPTAAGQRMRFRISNPKGPAYVDVHSLELPVWQAAIDLLRDL